MVNLCQPCGECGEKTITTITNYTIIEAKVLQKFSAEFNFGDFVSSKKFLFQTKKCFALSLSTPKRQLFYAET